MLEPWSQGPYLALLRKATEYGLDFGGECTGNYIEGRHVWLYRVCWMNGRQERYVVTAVPPEDLARYVGEGRRMELLKLPFDPHNVGPDGDVTPPSWRNRKRPALAQVA